MTCQLPRAEAVRDLRQLDAAPDVQLDAACRTARRLFGAPIALVALHDEDGLRLAARCGLDRESLPHAAAPCAHVIDAAEMLVVENLAEDPRFRDGPLVVGAPRLRFYAGAPLALDPDLVVGTLCVMDTEPRRFPADAVDALRDLAEMVVGRLRSHRARIAAEAGEAARRVSEAVIARQKLQISRRQREIGRRRAILRNTVESMDQGLMMVDGTGVIRVWNQRALDLLGLPASVMKGSPTFESIRRHQWEQGEFAAAPSSLVSTFGKQGLHVDVLCYERARPNGTVLEVRTVQLPDGGAVRTYTDVTARKQAAAELAASESRYRSLAETLPQKVYVTDAHGRMTYANGHVADYFGMDIETLEARSRIRHPDDAARLEELRARAVGEEIGIETETRLRRADGVYRWHRLHMSPIRRDESGPVEEWLHTLLDIDDIITAKRDLHEKAQLLSLAQKAAGAGVWERDLKTGVERLSPEAARMHGIAGGDDAPVVEIPTREWMSRLEEDDVGPIERAVAAAIESRGSFAREFRVPQPAAEGRRWRWLLGFGHVLFDEATGEPVRLVGLDLDVTAQREARDALRVTNDRLELALEASGVGLWDWDVTTGALWASEGCYRMLGLAADARAPGLDGWAALVHPDDLPAAVERLRVHMAGKTTHLEVAYRMKGGNGDWRWIQSRGRVVARDRNERPTRMIGVHSDITERMEAERREAHRARHDPLTGLPNRTLLDERLAKALWAFERQGRPVAVLCLDLDRFKSVNDMLGHAIGDALLSEVARRLRSAVRAQDTVARLGGDEFAIVQVGMPQPEGARAIAARVIDSLAAPMRVGEHEVCVGTSIGIALADRDCRDPKALLLNADVALYRAKDEERNAFRLYEPAMDAVAADRRALELDLRGALARREFTLHLQPIVTLASGAVSGYEALVRWRHPTRGLVSPGEFIPICEQTGMIAALGNWVMREACVLAARWPDPVRIAVNVSAVQLRRDDFTAGVVSALAHAGLPAHRLELEFTETVLMQNGERVLGTLRTLRELGVRIALDDFGTGYSSLSYLSRFTFDKIKIDRSFVSNIDDGDTAAIVRAVVDLGARWGSTITAEGIETPTQLARVRSEGCHEAQGYLIGHPRPAEDWLVEAEAEGAGERATVARRERSAASA